MQQTITALTEMSDVSSQTSSVMIMITHSFRRVKKKEYFTVSFIKCVVLETEEKHQLSQTVTVKRNVAMKTNILSIIKNKNTQRQEKHDKFITIIAALCIVILHQYFQNFIATLSVLLIKFTGHSLGAGVAAITANLFLQSHPDLSLLFVLRLSCA